MISRIRKVTLTALKSSGLGADLWATKDSAGDWVVVCRTCIMVWTDETVDHDSTKLDKLIVDGLESNYMVKFEDYGWFSEVVREPGKLVKAEKAALKTSAGVAFEYIRSWSKKVGKQKAFYRPEYLALAEEIADGADLKYAVYPNGTTKDGAEKVWLLIYEGKRPFMVISNVVETADAEEDPCPATG
jgi:hypothetical protein